MAIYGQYFLLMNFVELLPQTGRVYASQVQHVLGSRNAPAHTAAFHTILNYVTTGSFNKTRRNWIALGKVLIVLHPVRIAFQERTNARHVT